MTNPTASNPSIVRPTQKKYPQLRPLTPAEQQLVEENMGLARKLAGQMAAFLCGRRRWGTKSPYLRYYEELLSAGYVGLCIAAQRYDPDMLAGVSGKKAKFSTYACWWIRQQVNYASADLEMRWGPVKEGTYRTREYQVSLFGDRQQEDRKNSGSRNTLDIWDSRTGDDPCPEHEVSEELIVLLSLAIDEPRWLRLLRGWVFEGKTLDDLGKLEGGITRSRAQQIISKTLKRLREAPGVVSYLQDKVQRQKALSQVDFAKTGVLKLLA